MPPTIDRSIFPTSAYQNVGLSSSAYRVEASFLCLHGSMQHAPSEAINFPSQEVSHEASSAATQSAAAIGDDTRREACVRPSVFLFIHGYATTFEQAVRRASQMRVKVRPLPSKVLSCCTAQDMHNPQSNVWKAQRGRRVLSCEAKLDADAVS